MQNAATHKRRHYFYSFLVGGALPLAYAPLGWFPLAVLMPAVLFWFCWHATPRQAFKLGYLFGMGFFGVGVSWVAVSFYRFGGMGPVLSFAATVLFVLFLALFPAVMAWLSRRYYSTLKKSYYLLLLMPALWVLFEWIRGWILTGFPWLALGYSQTDAPLIGLAPVFGVYGVSWSVAMSASLLVWAVLGRKRQRVQAGVVVLMLWLLAGGLAQIDWSRANGKVLTASLIQGNVPQNIKWRPEQRAPTIELYTRLSRERWDRDVVIWPETALPVYFHQAKSFLENLALEASKKGGATLMVGLPLLAAQDDERYYNALVRVAADAAGKVSIQIYRKHHLVPFGEYIPLKSVLGELLDILRVPMANFSRGAADQPLLEIDSQKVGVSICYEDAFGEEVIRTLPDASLLVNVSNDAWFGDSFAPHQHLQMARMRSIETSRPMLRATNNGISAIIDHHGVVKDSSPQFEVAVLDGKIQPQQGATWYVRLGNAPVLVGLALVLIVCSFAVRQASRERKQTRYAE
ncbi:MAG TPA: apolipoprotein N-acyltransferase [Gammaproteobacteria bacterium]|nr:apolipoprotein N-acyltransferase [Gammaproteobacteria bacterium]